VDGGSRALKGYKILGYGLSLVCELAGDGIPVTVTYRVLKITRQPYYRWLKSR
jgi:hypothetical protein